VIYERAVNMAAIAVVEGYDTNHDTKSTKVAMIPVQVVEEYGGDDGTRTRGLCRDRAAF
jgi:hypothetical protein